MSINDGRKKKRKGKGGGKGKGECGREVKWEKGGDRKGQEREGRTS